ncbi:ATP cone domain-containing protein, partial [Bacteroidota bacterium]
QELEKDFKQGIPDVEEIQDYVEKVLIEEGHAQTAKSYILYREERRQIRESKKKEHDCEEVKDLRKKGILLSKQAIEILNNSRLYFLTDIQLNLKKKILEKETCWL